MWRRVLVAATTTAVTLCTSFDAPAAPLSDQGVHPAPSAIATSARSVLDLYYSRPPDVRNDSPWNLLHWCLAYGKDAKVVVAEGGSDAF
jgi:hypothetical protein